MSNHFDMNKAIANAHIRAEQLKGLLFAWAKILLVIVSGILMFLGFLMALTDIHFVWNVSTLQALGAGGPVAFVLFLFAVVIEAGILLSAGVVIVADRLRKIELAKFEKVKHSYPTQEMQDQRKAAIMKKGQWSLVIMIVCIGFSVLGAEIFWQKAFEHQSLFYHLAGIPLGAVCSVLLLFFEFHEEIVQQRIESVISSTALIQLALDQSAKAKIMDKLFHEQGKLLQDGQGFNGIIREAARQHLVGSAQDAIGMTGLTVTAEQLLKGVQDEQEAITAADTHLATTGENMTVIPMQRRFSLHRGGRMTDERKKVLGLVKKYGASRILDDPGKYAGEIGVSEKTLRRWAGQ